MAVNKVLAVIEVTIAYLLLVSKVALSVNNTMDSHKTDLYDVFLNLEYKLEKFTTELSQVDTSLQSLQEKSHTWEIFRHHIDAWNEQMKSLELKLEALQRLKSTKEADAVELTSVKYTLDHILSKVINMADKCQSYNENNLGSNKQEFEMISERESLIQDYEKATGDFKRTQFEALSRMNNILRYVHNVDYKRMCEKKKFSKQHDFIKNSNSNDPYFEGGSVNKYLKNWENNKNISLTNVGRDLEQLHVKTNKNSKKLDSLAKTIGFIEEKLSIWHDNAENNINYMIKECQSASKELSTFSESSDLLLKRIEFLVNDVDQKLSSINWNFNEHTSQYNKQNTDTDIKKLSIEERDEIDYDMGMTEMSVEHSEIFSTTEDNVLGGTKYGNAGKNAVEFIQPKYSGCHELNVNQRIDGIYKFASPLINSAGRDFNERFCVFGENNPAWTVIQNRGPYMEQENFNRSWSAYSTGFGDLNKDFWFGNDFIHRLVYQNDYEIRIEMENFDNEILWAEYKIFRIESEAYNYNLLIGEYQGTVGDAMRYHNNMDFSTYDRRNDRSVDACCSCAITYGSGWWFNNCSEANLNGIYRETPTGHNYIGIIWELWQQDYSLYKVQMMIRPRGVEQHLNNKGEYNDDP